MMISYGCCNQSKLPLSNASTSMARLDSWMVMASALFTSVGNIPMAWYILPFFLLLCLTWLAYCQLICSKLP
ncbi:MAG: DUF2534 family protein [Flavobacterium sp.]